MLDICGNDAFSVLRLTAAINEIDHVPGRAGQLAFVGVGSGVPVTTITVESKAEILSLIATSARGGPGAQANQPKGKLRPINIPHIKKEERIGADQVQDVRAFGTEDQLAGVETVVNQAMLQLTRDHDLTLEHHRLGALRGKIFDADGVTLLTDLFTIFGVTQEPEFDFVLGTPGTEVRSKCHEVIRIMKRNAKLAIPAGASVHALCSDSFFDALLEHANVKGVYDGWFAAERRLGESWVHGIFEFGGIFFENYQGTDDNSTVAIATDKCNLFWSGIPGMYAEWYAPATFMETVNTIGLPRYAKLAQDPRVNEWVELHTQQNPLPICLRPKTLIRAKKG